MFTSSKHLKSSVRCRFNSIQLKIVQLVTTSTLTYIDLDTHPANGTANDPYFPHCWHFYPWREWRACNNHAFCIGVVNWFIIQGKCCGCTCNYATILVNEKACIECFVKCFLYFARKAVENGCFQFLLSNIYLAGGVRPWPSGGRDWAK